MIPTYSLLCVIQRKTLKKVKNARQEYKNHLSQTAQQQQLQQCIHILIKILMHTYIDQNSKLQQITPNINVRYHFLTG